MKKQRLLKLIKALDHHLLLTTKQLNSLNKRQTLLLSRVKDNQ